MSYGGGNGYADYGNGAGNGNGGHQQDWSGPGFRLKFKQEMSLKCTFWRNLKKATVTAAVAMTLMEAVVVAAAKVVTIKDRIFQGQKNIIIPAPELRNSTLFYQ